MTIKNIDRSSIDVFSAFNPRTPQKIAPQTSLNPSEKSDTFSTGQRSQKENILPKAAVALVPLAVFLISKGVKKLSYERIPNDLKTLFRSLKNEDGESFIDKAYQGLVRYMKLEDVAPKSVKVDEIPFNTAIAAYNFEDHTITYSSAFLSLPKRAQFGALAHELTHCRQFTSILRHEDVGVDRYALMHTLRQMNSPRYIFKSATSPGGAEAVKKELLEKYKELIPTNFKDVLELPKIKRNSFKGKKVLKYIKGAMVYEQSGKNYDKNILEKEAYSFGLKMEDLYSYFSK